MRGAARTGRQACTILDGARACGVALAAVAVTSAAAALAALRVAFAVRVDVRAADCGLRLAGVASGPSTCGVDGRSGISGFAAHSIGLPVSFSIDWMYFVSRACHDRLREARAAGAAGAADAVDVVFGMGRHVEIEDVADGRDIEAARRDVARDEQLELSVAETVERLQPRVLVHVAVQRADRIAVALERAVEGRDVALAVAEDDGVGEIGARRVDELAKRRALLVRLAAGRDEALDDVLAGRGGLGDLDADRVAAGSGRRAA